MGAQANDHPDTQLIQLTRHIAVEEADITVQPARTRRQGRLQGGEAIPAMKLFFNVKKCDALTDEMKKELRTVAARHMTRGGMIILTADRHHSAHRNRVAVIEKLAELVRSAEARVE